MYLIKLFFLVPDSCKATVRNGNSISVDCIEDTLEKYYNDALITEILLNVALNTMNQPTNHNCRIN
jgi:hypothetical protein